MVDTTFVQFLSLPRTKKELVFYQLADIFLTKPDSFNTWVLLLFMVAFSQYGGQQRGKGSGRSTTFTSQFFDPESGLEKHFWHRRFVNTAG
jgi:hypothetical protein